VYTHYTVLADVPALKTETLRTVYRSKVGFNGKKNETFWHLLRLCNRQGLAKTRFATR